MTEHIRSNASRRQTDGAAIKFLISRCATAEEIGAVFGVEPSDLFSDYSEQFADQTADRDRYLRARRRRLLRGAGRDPDLRDFIYRAAAIALGEHHYPLDLCNRLANAIRSHVRQPGLGRSQFKTIFGYSLTDLMEHLAARFAQGMTWDNWGDWHIDHIRPRSSFADLTIGSQEFAECFALTNLRPLWAADNLKKGSKYE